jgi:hypothetical protein
MKKLIALSALLSMHSLIAYGQSAVSLAGYTYKNLTVFLIQGQDELARNYITLAEAMEQKKITLLETGRVSELSANNLSPEYIFIMAGDIVKGGRQDRTISEDIVLPPGARNVPLKSFCVEQSRWGNRGSENAAVFSSSEQMLNNKALKIAARTERSQAAVWEEVANYQANASRNAGGEVRNAVSPTSLQLTLENRKIKRNVTGYVNILQPAFDGKDNVLGFAFFVNGKISTVETFGNAALFKKLQKKLLEAAAFEAFEQYDVKLEFSTPFPIMLNTFIEAAEKGAETARQTSTHIIEYTKKTNGTILLRTINTDAGNAALHTSIYSTE